MGRWKMISFSKLDTKSTEGEGGGAGVEGRWGMLSKTNDCLCFSSEALISQVLINLKPLLFHTNDFSG